LTVLTSSTATDLISLTNCPGTTARFSTAVTGSGPFTYQWAKDGSDLLNETHNSLTVSNVGSSDAGSYCVLVSGACNRLTNCATLTVLTPAECPGAAASLIGAELTGDNAPRITGIQVSGSSVIVSFTTGQDAKYRLERADSLSSDGWTTAVDNVTGSGKIVTVTDPAGAATPSRFYRIRRVAP